MTQDRKSYMRAYQSRPERKAYRKAYYEANKEKLQEQGRKSARRWRAKHPDKIREAWEKWYAENPGMKMIHRIKSKANHSNIPFDLTPSDIQIPNICPILGIPITFDDPKAPGYPNLDRIVPSKGYVSGNVKIISRKANLMKQDGTAEQHEAIAKYIKENSGTEFVQ